MDRAFESAVSATPPSAPASPAIGYPRKGNPGTGTAPTKPGEYWYYMITEALRNIIVAAGLTPDHTDLNLLLQALPGALASRPEMARSLASNGYQKLPGGFIIQWGYVTPPSGENVNSTTNFPISFPNGCLCLVITDSSSIANNAVVWAQDTNSPTNFSAHWARSGMTLAGPTRAATYIAIGW